MRKKLKWLDWGRADRYYEVLLHRIMTWEKRIADYKLDLVSKYEFPQHIKYYIIKASEYLKPSNYSTDQLEWAKMMVKNVSNSYELLRTTMEGVLVRRAINYDDYIEGNKSHDFRKNPFVRIIASGEDNMLLCYVTDVEKKEKSVLVRGILLDDKTFENKVEKELLFDWCRILPMKEDDFKDFCYCYRNCLLLKGNTVLGVREEEKYIINIWENLEYGNNE